MKSGKVSKSWKVSWYLKFWSGKLKACLVNHKPLLKLTIKVVEKYKMIENDKIVIYLKKGNQEIW